MAMDTLLVNIRGNLNAVDRWVSDLLEEASAKAREIESLEPKRKELAQIEGRLATVQAELTKAAATKAHMEFVIQDIKAKLAALGIKVE
jgi:hypothetical protein